ncbi:diaminopimelate decarboxylase [Lachnospiraceae bacterium]|nr:diaminopimelate decarboxylase [Lachnospiraceae bacterium]
MTPCYVFSLNELNKRISKIKEIFGDIPLTYSIKANPFLVEYLPENISHIEACSPGELDICIRKKINPSKIIYSGVMKEYEDVKNAIIYGTDIITIESYIHYDLVRRIAHELGKRVSIIIRLTSGNQFGMSKDDIVNLLNNNVLNDSMCKIVGFHYYSGTQKSRTAEFQADISNLTELLQKVENDFGFRPDIIEYGPGLAVDYFREPYEAIDMETIRNFFDAINEFAAQYPLTIEMGRFIASTCGRYKTEVKDIKTNYDVTYAIVDGGIHQINYYKQILSMTKPPLSQWPVRSREKRKYTICGSLCTVADVLVKEIELNELGIGDILTFYRVGAYSMCEASNLFLSRKMPVVYIESENNELFMVRNFINTDKFNCP